MVLSLSCSSGGACVSDGVAALRGAPDGSGGAAVPRVQARRRAAVRALSYVKRLPFRVRPRRAGARAVARASEVAFAVGAGAYGAR